MSVEFKAAHADLLEKALNSLGWKYSRSTNAWSIVTPLSDYLMRLDLATGKAVIQENQQAALNKLKQAYSMEALKKVAQINRWNLIGRTSTKGSLIRSYA